jgi:enoyl-[acyl-carrier protein] reductase I
MACASFLDLNGKTILIFGVADKKSIAYRIGEILRREGARVIYSVRAPARRDSVARILPAGSDLYVCDVEKQDEIDGLARRVSEKHPRLYGIVHSIAFANYPRGLRSFHETDRQDFLRAIDVSCFSLVSIANAFKGLLQTDGAVVAISISTTRMAAENYGYLAPAKAALDSSIVFLAKSFSAFSQIRFNSVCAGLLKTNASAGIPGYVDSYLFAERATLRKKAVQTEEVANAAVFLLSPCSSGINGQGVVVDAGMSVNYFDHDLVKAALKEHPK